MQYLRRVAAHMQYEDDTQQQTCAIIASYHNQVVGEWNQFAQDYWRETIYPRMLRKLAITRQPVLYPAASFTKARKLYMLDRVVRIKNYVDKEDRLFANGDDGLLVHRRTNHSTRKEEICVLYFRGQFEWVAQEKLREEFQLAYAMTAHKLQGSTHARVLLIEDATAKSRYRTLSVQSPYVVATRPRAQLSVFRNDLPYALHYRYDHPISAFFNRASGTHTFEAYERNQLPRYVKS
jgi:hypothetical protein